MEEQNKRYNKANRNKEYKYFITKYVLPLMGIRNNNLEKYRDDAIYKVPVIKDKKLLIFSAGGEAFCKLSVSGRILNATLNLANSIMKCFNFIAEYNYNGKLKNKYTSDSFKEQAYEYAVQQGISIWMFGSSNKKIDDLVSLLEKWSTKTYEGKKVPFAFNINKEIAISGHQVEKDSDWLKFLRQDLSAVFTDGVSSAIELDKECNFIKYLSILTAKKSNENKQYLPFRFSEMISNHVDTKKKVGIFLLVNGDIILVKHGQIYFVKRNSTWLNFSYDAFYIAIKNSEIGEKITQKLLKEVYASILDVSFSHAGGIISIVGKSKLIKNDEKSKVLHVCDDISNGKEIKEVEEILKIELKYDESNTETERKIRKDIESRLLKRKIVQELVKDNGFVDIDRKLRSELISLDGASLIDFNGKVISFGAIIQNDSGSSGGGRGAAAKKLSNYGMAVKISTDGYIEIYVNGKCIYEIK